MATDDDLTDTVLEYLRTIGDDLAKLSVKVNNIATEIRSLNVDLDTLVQRRVR